jgi:hypothetical protein
MLEAALKNRAALQDTINDHLELRHLKLTLDR